MGTTGTPSSGPGGDRAAARAHTPAGKPDGHEPAIVLVSGTTDLPGCWVAELSGDASRAEETATFLRTRQSRRNVAHGRRDLAAGRTGTLDSLAAALTRRTS